MAGTRMRGTFGSLRHVLCRAVLRCVVLGGLVVFGWLLCTGVASAQSGDARGRDADVSAHRGSDDDSDRPLGSVLEPVRDVASNIPDVGSVVDETVAATAGSTAAATAPVIDVGEDSVATLAPVDDVVSGVVENTVPALGNDVPSVVDPTASTIGGTVSVVDDVAARVLAPALSTLPGGSAVQQPGQPVQQPAYGPPAVRADTPVGLTPPAVATAPTVPAAAAGPPAPATVSVSDGAVRGSASPLPTMPTQQAVDGADGNSGSPAPAGPAATTCSGTGGSTSGSAAPPMTLPASRTDPDSGVADKLRTAEAAALVGCRAERPSTSPD